MNTFTPKFTITSRMTSAITHIERARGFLEAARLSDDWVRDMGAEALIKEAHHTTHIEGTQLTLDQAERLWRGETVPGPTRMMRGSCSTTVLLLNSYRTVWTAALRSLKG